MAIVDFTNPEASAWYTSHLMRLMDMGVDSFKTDFAERIPFQNVKFHDGSDPVRMHNYYSILYNKAVYQAMISRVGRAKVSCSLAVRLREAKHIPCTGAEIAKAHLKQWPNLYVADSA